MGDLKEAIESVLNQAIEVTSENTNTILDTHVLVPKASMDLLARIYNLCFIEPEDDVEFQAWRES